ncbi:MULTISPECIES: hypothetical protein [unclassified Leifsonia]|uniref:hypothetical protein n=1 Tax=unclassified Leifsonia TaxID=2663824 RepID=UPI0006FD8F26|nr:MULTISPECIES: hypothetical protein [unclassified Leifsonia]KQX07339.1 hypothetical protein ASC59_06050 [Leifsonia sp. Root1293]KRA11621.1 hypothetical protein ASD61_06050 [Leifsonia sp. Root60]
MAGPGKGEARIIVEAGTSRFVATTRTLKGPVTADTFLEALPRLEEQMAGILARAKVREQRPAQPK